jgi:hypothetical protein
MDVPHDAVLLRIFTSVSDRCGMSPLYVAIVERALAMHLAGATVLRGPLGFGHSSRLHKGSLFPRARHRRDRRQRGKDRGIPPGARRDDGERIGHDRERHGDPLSAAGGVIEDPALSAP